MNKPFKRIVRPIHSNYFGHSHLVHLKYCGERIQLLHAYFIIENDFKKIMEYVEFSNDNINTYSHRLYELLLRICTEFENNCKGILKINGYNKTTNLNITDYFLINKASKLNEYTLRLNNWFPEPIEFKPFVNWSSESYSPLDWYQAYNNVKHNRTEKFSDANLNNVLKAIGGLFVILHSQYGRNAYYQFQETIGTTSSSTGFQNSQDSIFSIKYPDSWSETDFIENIDHLLEIEDEENLFRKYDFN